MWTISTMVAKSMSGGSIGRVTLGVRIQQSSQLSGKCRISDRLESQLLKCQVSNLPRQTRKTSLSVVSPRNAACGRPQSVVMLLRTAYCLNGVAASRLTII